MQEVPQVVPKEEEQLLQAPEPLPESNRQTEETIRTQIDEIIQDTGPKPVELINQDSIE